MYGPSSLPATGFSYVIYAAVAAGLAVAAGVSFLARKLARR